MKLAEKAEAESILQALLLGCQVVGAEWYPFEFRIVFARLAPSHDQPIQHEGNPTGLDSSRQLLTIESRWAVYAARPERLPASEEEMSQISLAQQVAALARLSGQVIKQVALGDGRPHLILDFEAGALLYINGHDAAFECWNLTTDATAPQQWLIVATPGDDLTIIRPAG
ncbi:MAG TPA: hypothetical protein VF812_05310 [Ktedonobacterales bacterium]